jgi:hypothetical protein
LHLFLKHIIKTITEISLWSILLYFDKYYSVHVSFSLSPSFIHVYSMSTWGTSPVVKLQGREVDHSPPSSAELKSAWNYCFIPHMYSWRAKRELAPCFISICIESLKQHILFRFLVPEFLWDRKARIYMQAIFCALFMWGEILWRSVMCLWHIRVHRVIKVCGTLRLGTNMCVWKGVKTIVRLWIFCV